MILFALLVVGGAQGRPQTTRPSLTVDVHVTISDTKIVLSRRSAPRGVLARFIIRNTGARSHNFTLRGVPTPAGMRRTVSETLAAGQLRKVAIFLDFRGRFAYDDALHADLAKPAMKGFFVVS